MGTAQPSEISQLRTTISRLTDQINAQVASQVAAGGGTMPRSAAQAMAPAVAHYDANAPHAPLSSLAAQVAERKRQLAEEAARRAAPPAVETPAPTRPEPKPARAAEASPEPVAGPRVEMRSAAASRGAPATDAAQRGNKAVRELSAKLDTIKTDLVGMKRALQRQSEARRDEGSQAEIERIASGIAALQDAPSFDPAGFDRLGDEIARLRQNMRGEMRDTVRNEVGAAVREAADGSAQEIKAVVDRLSHDIEAAAGSGAASAKVEALAGQVAELRNVVSDLPNTLAINRLEARLAEMAAPAPSHFELEGFAQLESRLDEISRALVAVGMGASRGEETPVDLSGVERLEARMADLMGRVETLSTQQDEEARAREEAARARDAEHQETLRELREATEMEAVTNHLIQLSERLTQIEHHAETSSRAAARALSRTPDLTGLEAQLSQLAQRLEDNAAGDATSHQLAGLEAQVAGLAVSLSQLEGGGFDLSPVEARLAEIENRFDVQSDTLAHGFEAAQERLAVAAAQNAAEQVAATLGHHTQDGRAMAALAAELGAVQTALESAENRSGEMLGAVRQTLDVVTQRLGAIETGMQAQSGHLERMVAQLMQRPPMQPAAATSAPAMPAAAMPAAAQLAVPRVDAPSLDASDMFEDGLDADFAGADDGLDDRPIEPGHAAAATAAQPDIASIVRDATARLSASAAPEAVAEATRPSADVSGADAVAAFNAANGPSADARGTPDVIAAARRAVMATREELAQAEGSSTGADGAESGGSVRDLVRKPIVMAAGAVILAAAAAYAGWTYLKADAVLPKPRASVTQKAKPAAAKTTVTRKVVPITTPAAEAVAADDRPAAPVREIAVEAPKIDAAPGTDSPNASRAESALAPRADDAAPLPTPVVEAPAVEAPAGEPAVIEAAAPATRVEVPAEITETPLRAAAGGGDRLALHEIGVRYSEGRGVERNMEEAARWFARAAERGFAPSQYSLGSLYEKGLGVPRNVERAKALYGEAAEKGNARAMHNLAVVHAMGGEGQAADLKAATKWFIEAAALGVKDSQFNLGILYGQGMGVPQNLAESYKWFSIAARTGDKDAIEKQDEVAAAMDATALAKAKEAADAWRAETPDRATNDVSVPAEWRSAAVAQAEAGAGAEPAVITDAAAVKRAQGLLNRVGFTVGKPDGKAGPRTKRAITAFQRTWSLPASGALDARTMAALEDANT